MMQHSIGDSMAVLLLRIGPTNCCDSLQLLLRLRKNRRGYAAFGRVA